MRERLKKQEERVLELNRVHEGDCLGLLGEMEGESVNCCVTSPPSFGLRSYNTAPQVWGGDPKCEHVWKDTTWFDTRKNDDTAGEKQRSNGGSVGDRVVRREGTCLYCGAWKGELGQEPTPELYIGHLMLVMDEVRRVLRKDGTCFVNIGDSYSNPTTGGNGATGGRDKSTLASKMPPIGTTPTKKNIQPGMPKKSLMAIPARFQLAMIERGWICRNEIVWYKKNAMPASVKDRFTVDFEPIYFFTKSERYWFCQQKEPSQGNTAGAAASFKRENSKRGESICPNSPMPTHRPDREEVCYDGDDRNLRTVWDIPTESFSGAHFAVFPAKLAERMVLAGCPAGGVVLDPFGGSGTTGMVARMHNRNYILCELNPEYAGMARERIATPYTADFREPEKVDGQLSLFE
jgi:site-specific DNA-methyltransferase (adenine-specific)